MTQEEILEGNKLIAEFMGAKPCKNYWREDALEHEDWEHDEWTNTTREYFVTKIHKVSELKYHSSWDWLMPVVEKIEMDCKCDVHIYAHYNWKEPNRCAIYDWKDKEIASKSNDSKIIAVWLAVVEFIKWHNNETR